MSGRLTSLAGAVVGVEGARVGAGGLVEAGQGCTGRHAGLTPTACISARTYTLGCAGGCGHPTLASI